MRKNKSKQLPRFRSVGELTKFFETHDMGEYWDQMPEAHFDIQIEKRTHIVALDEDLIEKLSTISKAKHVPSDRLVNAWLREKLSEQ